MMNSHVIKYYKWKQFLAVKQGRQLSQLFWASEYNREVKNK